MTEGHADLDKYKPKKDRGSKQINILMASRLLVDKGVQEYCNAAGAVQKKYDFNAMGFPWQALLILLVLDIYLKIKLLSSVSLIILNSLEIGMI